MRGGAHCREDETEIACRFLRDRNALLVSGDFGPVFTDCYLNLATAGMVLGDGADDLLKSTLAAVALCAATRPRGDTIAWTLHFEQRSLNVFAAAENATCRLVGRVFARNIRRMGGDVLHAEVAGVSGERRRSSVQFSGDVLEAGGQFYARSEQRPGRFFALGGDVFAALVGQPDCDEAWLAAATVEEVSELTGDSAMRPLEVRRYAFSCGCSPEKIAVAIGGVLRASLDEVYGDDSHINVDCPRCGLRHELARGLFG